VLGLVVLDLLVAASDMTVLLWIGRQKVTAVSNRRPAHRFDNVDCLWGESRTQGASGCLRHGCSARYS
jgi:hypothetical protein